MLNSLNRYKVDMKVKVLTRMIDNLRYSIQFSGQNTSRDDDRMTQSPLPHRLGLRVKMCVWLGVSRGLDLAFLNAD